MPDIEVLPEQTDDDLHRQAQEINQAANNPSALRAHLDRRCGNCAKPHDSAAFKEEYRQHLPRFMGLRARAIAQSTWR